MVVSPPVPWRSCDSMNRIASLGAASAVGSASPWHGEVRGSNPPPQSGRSPASCTGLLVFWPIGRFCATFPESVAGDALPIGARLMITVMSIPMRWSPSCRSSSAGTKHRDRHPRVYIASPEGANGRNVVAYGMLNALLTSKYKTMVFRPFLLCPTMHDEFTRSCSPPQCRTRRGPVHRPRCAQGARG